MTTAGCATSSRPPLARQITRNCENLAQRVPLPSIKKGDDARVQVGRHRAGLVKANGRLDATRNCQARQRTQFSTGQ